MRVRFFGRSDTGRRRTTNEDSYVLCDDEGLGAVCDGMGGHDSGEIASRMAVDLFAEQSARGAAALRGPRKRSQLRAMAQDMVLEWTQEANKAIHDRGNAAARPGGAPGAAGDDAAKGRMGTTLALVFFVSDFVVVANVGDSRVYRIREEKIALLSHDHVVMADARRHAADPRPPRKRKFVTRALGTKSTVEPDISLHEVAADDVFLLCSDGLTDLVTDEDILTHARRAGPDRRRLVRSLIELANKRGGTDNVTVVVAEVLGDREDSADETDVLPIGR